MSAPTVVAIDIGGTKMLAGRVREDGSVERALESATPLDDRADVLELIERLVGELRDEATVAVGFSSLTLVPRATDELGFAGRVPLAGFPLRSWAADRFELPIAVENDGNAAALGESRLGAGRGLRDMVMFVIGTGIGGGLILNGELYRGAGGVAGEIGQITIDANEGEARSLENLASGLAIDARAELLARGDPASDIGRAAADGARPGARLLLELAERSQGAARDAVDEIGWLIGLGVCSIVDVFNPELIVLGGGVLEGGERILDAVRATVLRRVLPPARDEVKVERSALGTAAGMLGAAIAGFERVGEGAAVQIPRGDS